ncbi:MAG: amino acid ABC transporter permease [Thermodesulfobacteriota bacterium]
MAQFVFLAAFLIWLAVRGAENLGYNWQWDRVLPFLVLIENGQLSLGALLRGVGVTLEITGLGLILSTGFGLTAALLRLSGSFTARVLARTYVELIRNTPLLIQLFFIYFVLAPVLGLGRFTSAVLALSLFEGAYAGEIIRGGIVSLHQGQWQAAYSLGLSWFHTYRYVILPQAFRRVLPPLTGQAVSLLKDSALVSTIAIYDLSMQAQAIVAETFLAFEIWFTVAAIYLALAIILSSAAQTMEARLKIEH